MHAGLLERKKEKKVMTSYRQLDYYCMGQCCSQASLPLIEWNRFSTC